jgi:hypothetical protein
MQLTRHIRIQPVAVNCMPRGDSGTSLETEVRVAALFV